MAKKKDKIKSTKRFGARYGARNKIKLDKAESQHRQKQKCPYCNYKQVKRMSVGIWICNKCDSKFTARAYTAKRTPLSEIREELEPEEDSGNNLTGSEVEEGEAAQ